MIQKYIHTISITYIGQIKQGVEPNQFNEIGIRSRTEGKGKKEKTI